MKKYRILIISLFALVLLTGCVPTDVVVDAKPAGFFSGLWHGWIAPISLIMSFFDSKYSIYQTFNNGFMYDFGFYMAIISGFGSIALKRRKK